jgi:hypothetical protein
MEGGVEGVEDVDDVEKLWVRLPGGDDGKGRC